MESMLGLLLYSCKAHQTTALALNMLHQSTQHLVFSATASSRASIDVLLVEWASKVVVQTVQGRKISCAERAFIGSAIPGSFRSEGLNALVPWVSDHWFCDNIISVGSLNQFIDLLTVEP
jgi:hypothetical protein